MHRLIKGLLLLPLPAIAAEALDNQKLDGAHIPAPDICASEEARETAECRERNSQEAAQEALRDAEQRANDPVLNPQLTNPPPLPPR